MSSEKRDYYEVLGVAKDADKDQLKTLSQADSAVTILTGTRRQARRNDSRKSLKHTLFLSDDAKRAQDRQIRSRRYPRKILL